MDKLVLMVQFPKLAPPASFEITSPRTVAYNCIAWAAGETRRKWWPDKMGVAYWPKGVPREATLAAFIAAYATLGTRSVTTGTLSLGSRKSRSLPNLLGHLLTQHDSCPTGVGPVSWATNSILSTTWLGLSARNTGRSGST